MIKPHHVFLPRVGRAGVGVSLGNEQIELIHKQERKNF